MHAQHGTRIKSNLHCDAPHAPGLAARTRVVCTRHMFHVLNTHQPASPCVRGFPISVGASLLPLSTTTSSVHHASLHHGRISDQSNQSGQNESQTAVDKIQVYIVPISAIRNTAARSGTWHLQQGADKAVTPHLCPACLLARETMATTATTTRRSMVLIHMCKRATACIN